MPLTAQDPLFPQHTQQPGRVSRLPVLRRSAVASYAMRLSSRTALMDIGNLVTEPKAQGATRNPAMDGGCGREPGGRPVRSTSKANKVARRKVRTAPTEGVPPPAPEPKPEPQPQQVRPGAVRPLLRLGVQCRRAEQGPSVVPSDRGREQLSVLLGAAHPTGAFLLLACTRLRREVLPGLIPNFIAAGVSFPNPYGNTCMCTIR